VASTRRVLAPWVGGINGDNCIVVEKADIEAKGFPAVLGTNGDCLCGSLLAHEMDLMAWLLSLVQQLPVAPDHFISCQQGLSNGVVSYFIWYVAHVSPLPSGANPVLEESAKKELPG